LYWCWPDALVAHDDDSGGQDQQHVCASAMLSEGAHIEVAAGLLPGAVSTAVVATTPNHG